jgi:hypothetical protein
VELPLHIRIDERGIQVLTKQEGISRPEVKRIATVAALAALMFFSHPLHGESRPVLCVMDLSSDNIPGSDTTLLVDLLSYAISEKQVYVVMDRRQRMSRLSGLGVSLNVANDEEADIDAGDLCNASVIVRGRVTRRDGNVELSLAVIDVPTRVTIGTIAGSYSSIEDLYADARCIARSVVSFAGVKSWSSETRMGIEKGFSSFFLKTDSPDALLRCEDS